MSIIAAYVTSTSFTVSSDRTSDFVPGRAVMCDCGVDGIKYGYVDHSSYSTPNTTVTLNGHESQPITSNLESTMFSRFKLDNDSGNNPLEMLWVLRGMQTVRLRYKASNEITIDPGAIYIHDGNMEAIHICHGFDKVLAGLGASTRYYVYAKPQTVGRILDATYFEHSSSAPELDEARHGYYHPTNTDWRYIGCLDTDGSANIKSASVYTSSNLNVTAEQSLINLVGNVTGTANQVNVTGGTGAVIGSGVSLSLPQNIDTGAAPTFAGLIANGTIQAGANTATSGDILLKAKYSAYPAQTLFTEYSSGGIGLAQYMYQSGSSTWLSSFHAGAIARGALVVSAGSLKFVVAPSQNVSPGGALTTQPTTVFTINSTGKTGIGTTNPTHHLHVLSLGASSTYPGAIRVDDDTPMAVDVGGGITFGYQYTDVGDYTYGPAVKGYKINATSGNTSAGLAFRTRGTSTPSTKMVIDHLGNLGVGVVTFGTSAVTVFALGSGTAPSTSPADMFQMYSADQAAGNACPHFRTELGTVVKLYQQAFVSSPAADTAALKTAVDAIRTILINTGLMAAA